MPSLLIVSNVPSMLREFLVPHVEHLTARGWQVDALVSPSRTPADEGEELRAFRRIHRIAWSRNPLHPRNLITAPRRVRRIVAAGGYDIVHVHTPVAAFVTRFALRRVRPRPAVIYTAHGFHFHSRGSAIGNRLFLALERTAGRWTDYLVVMNREDEAAARRHAIVPEDRLVFVPGVGLNLSRYDPEGIPDEAVARAKAELGLGVDDRLLLMIAEFNAGKRHRDALAAFAALDRSNVVLGLAGVGPLEVPLRAEAARLGVADRVRFLGYRRDIPVLLRASAALLLPSQREGLPRAVLEALAMGTPVISTRIRGVEDLLEGGRGLMTDVGDTSALRGAMERLLDGPEGAQAMAARGREFVRAYDVEHVLRLQDALYARALGAAGGPPA